MKIQSAEFIKSVVGNDKILEDGRAQIALIGRSNVGKSSTLNALTRVNNLARTSALPGRTQEINIFLIDQSFYLVDLPGYGFAKASHADRAWLHELIDWYLFNEQYIQKKVVLIIDAKVGPTIDDLSMLKALEAEQKNILIIANKIDKLKQSEIHKQKLNIQALVGDHPVIFYSAKTGLGMSTLVNEIFN